jgi:hypothetical protein
VRKNRDYRKEVRKERKEEEIMSNYKGWRYDKLREKGVIKREYT